MQIRQLFTPEEEGYLICRVGYLNIFYPVIPEGWIELDCSRREERQASGLPTSTPRLDETTALRQLVTCISCSCSCVCRSSRC